LKPEEEQQEQEQETEGAVRGTTFNIIIKGATENCIPLRVSR
jgi:hypothetical protein